MRMQIGLIRVIRSYKLSLFLAGEDTLNVVELVQGLHVRAAVDVYGENLIACLGQHGVMRLDSRVLLAREDA